MWVLELLFDGVTDLMLHAGPRWMRIGCMVLLIVAVGGVVALMLYLWIFK
jgi:hypothetical protein